MDWLIGLSDGVAVPSLDSNDDLVAPASPLRTSIGFRGYVADLNIDIATNEIVRGTTIQRSGSVVPTGTGRTRPDGSRIDLRGVRLCAPSRRVPGPHLLRTADGQEQDPDEQCPVAREVKFSDGTTETVHFRQVSAGQMRRWRAAEASGNEDETCFAMQRLVAASLCDADGKLVLSEAESQNLTANGLTDLFPTSWLWPASVKTQKVIAERGREYFSCILGLALGKTLGRSTICPSLSSSDGWRSISCTPSTICIATTAQPRLSAPASAGRSRRTSTSCSRLRLPMSSPMPTCEPSRRSA